MNLHILELNLKSNGLRTLINWAHVVRIDSHASGGSTVSSLGGRTVTVTQTVDEISDQLGTMIDIETAKTNSP